MKLEVQFAVFECFLTIFDEFLVIEIENESFSTVINYEAASIDDSLYLVVRASILRYIFLKMIMLGYLFLKQYSFKTDTNLFLSFFFYDSNLQLQLVFIVKSIVSEHYYWVIFHLHYFHLRDVLTSVQFLTTLPGDEFSTLVQQHAQRGHFLYLFYLFSTVDFLHLVAATS